jgi:hypothetical protein
VAPRVTIDGKALSLQGYGSGCEGMEDSICTANEFTKIVRTLDGRASIGWKKYKKMKALVHL